MVLIGVHKIFSQQIFTEQLYARGTALAQTKQYSRQVKIPAFTE
jgi:hypothetical protein